METSFRPPLTLRTARRTEIESAVVVTCHALRRYLVLASCVLVLNGCDKPFTPETPWTMEIVSGGIRVVLKAPFGTFLIHQSEDIDRRNFKVSGASSVTTVWHYESRMPYGVWINTPEGLSLIHI